MYFTSLYGCGALQGSQSTALWHSWASLEERSGEPRVVRYLYKKGLKVQSTALKSGYRSYIDYSILGPIFVNRFGPSIITAG